jgi:uncharacterized membrane protein YcaP (DUF421 family)
MESILRALLVYFVLFALFRMSGKRTINHNSPFGLILTFLISSSVADALKGEDRSVTNNILIACTLAGIHLSLSLLKKRSPASAKVIDDVPTLLVKDGEVLKDRMYDSRVSEEDLLMAARKEKLSYINQIKYAILEIDGSICIIPK